MSAAGPAVVLRDGREERLRKQRLIFAELLLHGRPPRLLRDEERIYPYEWACVKLGRASQQLLFKLTILYETRSTVLDASRRNG